jgi:hypothetical protein
MAILKACLPAAIGVLLYVLCVTLTTVLHLTPAP